MARIAGAVPQPRSGAPFTGAREELLAGPSPQERALDDVAQFEVSGDSGDLIFGEGDAGTAIYIIEEGSVELLQARDGEESRVARLEPGDFFGELALLGKQPHAVSARALSDYRLLEIDRETFERIVGESPRVALRMLGVLAARLQRRPAAAPGTPATSAPDAEAVVESTLAVLIHEESGTEYELAARPELLVGRSDLASGVVPDIDLGGVDTHRTLSRRHAKILSRDGGFFVEEQKGVGNGTFVNGGRIEAGVPVKLDSGDHVRFGLVDTVFQRR